MHGRCNNSSVALNSSDNDAMVSRPLTVVMLLMMLLTMLPDVETGQAQGETKENIVVAERTACTVWCCYSCPAESYTWCNKTAR